MVLLWYMMVNFICILLAQNVTLCVKFCTDPESENSWWSIKTLIIATEVHFFVFNLFHEQSGFSCFICVCVCVFLLMFTVFCLCRSSSCFHIFAKESELHWSHKWSRMERVSISQCPRIPPYDFNFDFF